MTCFTSHCFEASFHKEVRWLSGLRHQTNFNTLVRCEFESHRNKLFFNEFAAYKKISAHKPNNAPIPPRCSAIGLHGPSPLPSGRLGSDPSRASPRLPPMCQLLERICPDRRNARSDQSTDAGMDVLKKMPESADPAACWKYLFH